MDSWTVGLAALKLAPVQCTSWGHPETSGFPTIDYFLSSDLMEPEEADNHYSEQLIRLPNLSVYYTPMNIPKIDDSRETFGLRPKSILYLCIQSLFKYLPQFDKIFPRIAQEIDDCQFIFISNQSSFVTQQFKLRLHQAFNQYNFNSDRYLVFLPFLNDVKYHALNCIADIYLDSIEWSGGNTTFEAIACDLPVVTLPGQFMRGRHSTAILTMMGVTETIASTIDEYIDLAIKLGKDSELRKYISDKIKSNKHRVYQDKTCITALENFLERVAKEKT
jgi:predicted O-linked N-acetylglucosamine transferase (SPINDLY family)